MLFYKQLQFVALELCLQFFWSLLDLDFRSFWLRRILASGLDFSGFGLLATDVVAKPRAGFPAGFFFLAMVEN
jgi:hypothetical protein